VKEFSDIEGLRAALDPNSTASRNATDRKEEEIWSKILGRSAAMERSHHRRRTLIGSGVVVVAVAASLAIGTLPSGRSAAAAVLSNAYEHVGDRVNMPALADGEYYYQSSNVQMYCGFSEASSTSDPIPPIIDYVTTGVRQSWIGNNGMGEVTLIANPTGVGGSRFATPEDQALWLSEGRPNNPCNPADPDNGALSGGMEFFGGFGYMFQESASQQTDAGDAINALPSSVATLSQMLSAGEINADATTSASPQACPLVLFAPGADIQPSQPPSNGPTGCTPMQQVGLVLALLQLPDASTKLSADLYQLLSQLPGATLKGTTQVEGVSGTQVQVPLGEGETVGVVIDPTSGALLECSVEMTESNADGTGLPVEDVVTYGQIAVVQGLGVIPNDR
jgi:hypothetical protein